MTKEKVPTEYNLRKMPRRPKGDVALLGLILGIVFTCIGLVLLYWLRYQDFTFHHYLKMFTDIHNPISRKASSRVISLSVILNLIPFYFFLSRKSYQTVKGVVIASALALLLVVFYLFIWQ